MPTLTGQPALPFSLPDTDGQRHTLEDFSGSWLLLVFHRHLGWLPCQGHLAQLREAEAELSRRQIKVAVVTFDNDYFARQYVASTGLRWPLLIDGERELYRGYGMLQATFWDIWGPPTWLAAGKALLRGTKPQRPGRDVYQRGGDVLIDPAGIVRLHHVGRGPADRPEVKAILAAVGT